MNPVQPAANPNQSQDPVKPMANLLIEMIVGWVLFLLHDLKRVKDKDDGLQLFKIFYSDLS